MCIISFCVHAAWSESLLCAQWVAKDPSFLHAGRTVTLLVLSCRGSNVYNFFLCPYMTTGHALFWWITTVKVLKIGTPKINVLIILLFKWHDFAILKYDPEMQKKQQTVPTLTLSGSTLLTHINLASHFWDIGKQCRPRSDAAERGVWSVSSLFANRYIYSK